MTEEEVADLMTVVIPVVISSIADHCRPTLAVDGFLAVDGEAMVERYDSQFEEAFPGAFSAALKMERRRETAKSWKSMTPEEVRGHIYTMFASKIIDDLSVENCGRVERIFSTLSPLEPHAVADMFSALFGLTGVDNPPICAPEN